MSSSAGLHSDPSDLYPLTFNLTTTITTTTTTIFSHDNATTAITPTTPPPPPTPSTTNTATDFQDAAVKEVLAAMLVVVMVMGVGGNGLLCALVYRKAAMRSAINLLVAQLALSDVLLSCGVMPLTLADLFLPVTLTWGRWLCFVEAFLLEVLVTLNMCLLLAVSVDRYLIIIHRKEKLTVRRSRVIILAAWGFSLLCAAPPLVGWGCFAAFSGHRLCVKLVPRSASDLSYLVVSSLVTKFLPMLAILYSYARIISTVRKKNTKVHHLAVDVSVTHSSGSLPRGPGTFPVPVDEGVREVFHTAGSGSGCGKPTCLSSSSAVSFISRSSTVRLHCRDRVPCCRHLCLSTCSSDCSLIKGTRASSSDNPDPASALSAPCGCHHNGSVALSRHHAGESNGTSFLNELKNLDLTSYRSRRDRYQLNKPASTSCTHHPSRKSLPQTRNVVSSTSACSEASVSNRASSETGHPHSSGRCPCVGTSATWMLFESHADVNREPVELDRSVCAGNGVVEGGSEEHRLPPYPSSPSGFSPRANGVRRTAGCRRQVVDMSFKTRAFKTIFILSLLICICWSPFFTASLLTALASSSSSSSSSISSSSSSLPCFDGSSSPSLNLSSSSPSAVSSSSCSSSEPVSSSSSSSLSFTTSSSYLDSPSSSSSSSPSSSSSSSSPSSSSPSSTSSSSSSSPPPHSYNPLQLLSLLLWLGFLKTALNPVVYALRIRKFREVFRMTVMPQGCCCKYGADGCGLCPRWGEVLGKRRVNPGALYQC